MPPAHPFHHQDTKGTKGSRTGNNRYRYRDRYRYRKKTMPIRGFDTDSDCDTDGEIRRGRRAGTETGLLQTHFGKGGGTAVETDRDALVVGDHRQAVLPAQITQMPHLVGLAAEVHLAVNDPPPVEVRTQSRTVRTAIGGKDNDSVERCHVIHPGEVVAKFEIRNSKFEISIL